MPVSQNDVENSKAFFMMFSQDNIDAMVVDLCVELGMDQVNSTDDEDEQERIILTLEKKASDINNQGKEAQAEYLATHAQKVS